MLGALAAGLILAAQPTPTLDTVKGCLATAAARLDDGVSDASTVAQGAVESCGALIEDVVRGLAEQNRLNSQEGLSDIRKGLVAGLSKIAVEDVLEQRAQRQSSTTPTGAAR